ncbi:MAG: hypothetical protein ACTIM4_11550 [Marinomonas sp.]
MCISFGFGTAIGAAITTFFIVRYVGQFFPLLILVLLIFYTLFKPKRMPHFNVNDRNFFWVGMATGCMRYFRDISTFGGCTAGPAAALVNMQIIEDENLLENT